MLIPLCADDYLFTRHASTFRHITPDMPALRATPDDYSFRFQIIDDYISRLPFFDISFIFRSIFFHLRCCR